MLLAAAYSSRAGAPAADARAAAPIRVSLHPSAQIGDRLIRIGDVARISGGNAEARSQISKLDLLEVDADDTGTEVPRALVEARLLLGGWSRDTCRVEGAAAVQVICMVMASAEQRALRSVRSAVAAQANWPEEDVVVRLAQPLMPGVAEQIGATPQADLETRLTTPAGTGGRLRVTLWTGDGQSVRREVPVVVEVLYRQLAPVAARPLSTRRTLEADDILLEPRDLTRRGSALPIEQVVGKALRQPLAAGDLITDRDLIAANASNEPPVIQQRDVVKVTAKKGRLILIMPAAEAMQSGRQGEMIRIRNTKSGRVVVGRVTGPGEVEVPL
ncbi:MAG: flagellar basal body P-ring formation chaperone FlgA [Planctomycetaceae bacterium]